MKRIFFAGLLLLAGFAAGSVFVNSWLNGQPQPQPVLPRELTSYRDVVKRVLPAVVSIETHAKNKLGTPNPQFFDDPRLPVDPNRLGFGSGFIADPSGVVVTNFHVVEGAEVAIVLLPDGRKLTSKNIRSDRRTDVALILLDSKDEKFPALEFGDSDAMEIGDRVLAVGAPFGLAGSVTHGIISAKGRNGLHLNMYEDFLQTDAAINPGNSGGPLINLEGKVVGINAAIKSKSGGFQGVGLAVASNLAKNVVPSLRATGTVQRGYLGLQVRELTPEVAERLGVPKDAGGVIVAEVYDKTPADKAGLLAGDVITDVGARPVKDGSALQRIIATLPIKKGVAIDVLRDGKARQFTAVIEEQPAEYGVGAGVPAPRNARPIPAGASLDALGVDVTELTADLAADLGFRKDLQGMLITRIQDGGPASLADLKKGTVITKINNTAVTSLTSARQAVAAGDAAKGLLLQIATPQGGVSYLVVKNLR